MNETIKTLLALQSIDGLGRNRIRQLIQNVSRVEDIFSLNYHQLQNVSGFGKVLAEQILAFDAWDKVESVIVKTEESGAYIIDITNPFYPESLRQIPDPPVLLWVKGDIDTLSEPGIAVIGTRNPSTYGLEMAEYFSKQILQQGLQIISGLAYGIDTVSHVTAVKNKSKTVAVLGSGIDFIYPQKNTKLVNEILAYQGAVITEYLPGTKPDAGNFPERNRIVSGLSLGVLVVESAIKGGSRITAQLALDQNRDVFVIPHELSNPKGTGCNDLIKKGYGKLVQNMQDILDEIPMYQQIGLRGNLKNDSEMIIPIQDGDNEAVVFLFEQAGLSEEALAICDLIKQGINQIDSLAEQLKRPVYELLVTLLDLEFQGLVKQKAGKLFELR